MNFVALLGNDFPSQHSHTNAQYSLCTQHLSRKLVAFVSRLKCKRQPKPCVRLRTTPGRVIWPRVHVVLLQVFGLICCFDSRLKCKWQPKPCIRLRTTPGREILAGVHVNLLQAFGSQEILYFLWHRLSIERCPATGIQLTRFTSYIQFYTGCVELQASEAMILCRI